VEQVSNLLHLHSLHNQRKEHPMKWFWSLCVWLALVTTAAAHPGTSIVQDSCGNIFYTDLVHVWKITPDGKRSIAVRSVHSHELHLDTQDNLYGEHLWYEGDATKKWSHRLWCLKPDGKLIETMPAREFADSQKNMLRDGAGNQYWAERGTTTVIKKRTQQGRVSTHATGSFNKVGSMIATADGTLYFIDDRALRRVSPKGEVMTLANPLINRSGILKWPLYVSGLWIDGAGGIYVALYSEHQVVKVETNHQVVPILNSPKPWHPSGGTFARDGSLWLLEYNDANQACVRRIRRDGAEQVF
jgi:hypothetical protein